jgi:hypothetical protein
MYQFLQTSLLQHLQLRIELLPYMLTPPKNVPVKLTPAESAI